ncbi:FG-GAP repeat protein [Roseimaritima multifibrata]|uniref:FG-GAP repeat protein n=1 Tax=Roseimaritima multifibrata TaxID=1930274 RepID=A0A517MLR6_9BACT|nr:ELWxxDGT repeat protein [Roseimaritima multifibrata]QDS95836.1 FG-GAP repeat protein [Roseimaritima multifibrata]
MKRLKKKSQPLTRRRSLSVQTLETRQMLAANPILQLPGLAHGGMFTDLNDTVYFAANDGELWKTDGSVAGSQLVHDLGSAEESVRITITEMSVFNDQLVLTASDESGTVDLWVSDGTNGGTQQVYEFGGAAFSSDGVYFTEAGGQLFFSVKGLAPDSEYEIWKTDLTSGGTTMVTDLSTPGPYSESPRNLTSFNGELYFTAIDPGDSETDGRELWKSNGTVNTLVTDVNGPDGQLVGPVIANGELYFGTRSTDGSGISSSQLWKTDGTIGGEILIKDFGNDAPGLERAVEFNGKLIGVVTDEASGTELWVSDGTSAGTGLLKDIVPGDTGSYPTNLTKFNNELYFSANDGIHGAELWKTDGTEAGTVLVADINPGPDGSYPYGTGYPGVFAEGNNRLYFSATTATNGSELWSSDGTSQGTELVADLVPGTDGSYPYSMTFLQDHLFFGTYGINDGTFVLNPSNVDSIFAVSSGDTVIKAQQGASPGSLSSTAAIALPGNLAGRDVLTADTNGDGISDLLSRAADGWWYVSESAPNGDWTPFVKHVYWSTSYAWDEVRTGDFNGDGLEDLAGFEATGGRWLVSSSQATGLASSSIQTIWSPTITWSDIQVGDFNNDGRDDLFARAGGNKIVVAKSTGTNLPTTTWVTLAATEEWKDVLVGDFDGDGNDDFTARANAGGSIITGLSTGTAFSVSTWAHWSAAVDWSNTRVGDFNNDGRDDLITLGAGNRWMVVGSSGTAFGSQVTASWAASLSFHEVLVLDLDGDGNDDLATRTANNQWYVWTAPLQSINLRNWGTWSANVSWRSIQTGTST